MTTQSTEHPFGRFGSAVPAVSPPNLLPIPSQLAGQAGWEKESLDAMQVLLSNSQNTAVTSAVLATNPKHYSYNKS